MSFARCSWLNAPATWESDGGRLRVVTDAKTDFWRETHYGFIRDNGHVFACSVPGDFTAQLRVRARYDALYDQAGVMVRLVVRLVVETADCAVQAAKGRLAGGH